MNNRIKKMLIVLVVLINPIALSCLINVLPSHLLIGLAALFCAGNAWLAYLTTPTNPNLSGNS